MTANFLLNSKRLIFCLLITGFSSSVVLSQKTLSGILNQSAAHVVSIPASDRVTVDDATNFAINDTILLMQMQGVEILTGALDYGNINDFLGQPGMHEFMIIQSVNHLTQEIVFRNNLLKTYDTRGNIQIVRVAYYNSVVVTGTLTCNPWNSTTKTGGVLALIIGRSLKLNADIDVSSKGLIGGNDIAGEGRCQLVAPLTSNKTYPLSFLNAGFKGEGIAIHDFSGILLAPNNVKGNGPNFTGGGGGNGRFAGGGGGSNRGAGGIGGYESNACTAPQAGGLGGIKAESSSFPALVDRIYLGSGGGASTSLTGLSQPGGNGGGIVIIVTDTIIGNSHKIISNGGNGGVAVVNGGSGGGGAGGSVALSVTSYESTPLIISVLGGNGGDNPDNFGEGGGGGGGLFYYTAPPLANVQIFKDGGTQGNFSNPPINPGLPGDPGDTKPGFKAILNGFLFNSIRSSVTGNQVDSICSNIKPPKITGTIPVGGTPSYTFLWEKSIDQVTWILLPNDPDPVNFTPAAPEPVTVWYRRTITDQSTPTPLVDVSKPVKIIVQPKILNNNIVANPDTICLNSDPQILKQGVPDLIVPTTKYLKYIWQDSTVGGVWSPELAPETVKEYDPNPVGGLTKKTWYRRTVISGRCIDKGPGSIDSIFVLPKLANNAFSKLYDTICFGGTTNLNTNPGPTGGLSSDYRYIWQSNTTSSNGPWATVVGATLPAYNPAASVSLPVGDHFYRRIILSGKQDACKDTTKPVAVRKVWPVMTNYLIKSDQIIGYDSIPLKLTDSSGATLGGDGINYKYSWVKDTIGLPLAPVGTNGISNSEYQPPNLKYTISFRRIVKSSACSDTSNSVKIKVDAPITNVITLANSALDTIYTGQLSSKLNGSVPQGGSGINGDYSYKWYKSSTGGLLSSDWTLITDSLRITLYPGTLSQPTWFRRDVSSPKLIPRSTYQSNYLKVTVLPKITNVGITATESVCYGRRPLQLKGSDLLTGGDGKYRFTWQDSSSLHTWQNIINYVHVDSANFKPPSLIIDTWYKRIVYSGKNDCGVEVSNDAFIKVNPLPGAPYAGPDALSRKSIVSNYQMQATKPLTGETGLWKVLNGAGILYDSTSYNTTVANLSLGGNSFLWTVSNGLCKLSDSVNIELLKIKEPQGFSPNGDTHNDTFIIEGLNLVDNDADLIIVNGAGSEVFKTSSRNNQTWSDWNGKNSAGFDLPEGTYYYMLNITAKDPKGTHHKLSGFIVLKRYK
jgi:gliding motility-associated-like protein